MWFTAGTVSSQSVGYAESTDGLVWTRGANVLASNYGIDPCIIKVGSTYHLYCLKGDWATTDNIYHFTSSDGITWSSGAVVFSGAGSGWDAFVYFFSPVYIDGTGTWYAMYLGTTSNAGTASENTGLATSPDGLTWTRSASNPVVTNFYGVMRVINVNGVWYTWGQTVNPGRGGAEAGVSPGESLRLQTTDFIHWTNPVHSLHNGQLFESVNAVTGGCYASQAWDINGRALLYSQVESDDTGGTTYDLQISVAIGPATIASIVAGKEDATKQIASDAFTSGTGDLSANWVTVTGLTKLTIVSGPYCEASAANTNCAMLYTGATFSNDQYAECTIHALSGSDVLPTVRGQVGANSCYRALAGITTNSLGVSWAIYKKVSGASTQVGPSAMATPQVGDVIRLVASGSSPVLLSLYQNNYLVLQVEDWSNAFTSGYPGLELYATTSVANAQVSLWAAGNAGVLPFGVISGNAGVPGATISYSGATSGSVTADGSGNYTLPNLANGMYTITPSKAGVSFNPHSSEVTVSNGNITGINFVAVSSNNSLVVANNLLLTNGLLVTNILLAPNNLGGTNDWS
jgi:hypothetical protein